MQKRGRNSLCGCGSKKKFKKCCMDNYNTVRDDKISREMLARSTATSPYIDLPTRKRLVDQILHPKTVDSEE